MIMISRLLFLFALLIVMVAVYINWRFMKQMPDSSSVQGNLSGFKSAQASQHLRTRDRKNTRIDPAGERVEKGVELRSERPPVSGLLHDQQESESAGESATPGPIVVISNGGDMANRIGYLAFGHMVKLWIKDHYPEVNPILWHANFDVSSDKGDYTQCMATMRDMNIDRSDTMFPYATREGQIKQLKAAGIKMDLLTRVTGESKLTAELFEDTLKSFMNLYRNASSSQSETKRTNAERPFLPVHMMAHRIPFLLDLYIDKVRGILNWDTSNPDCCSEKAANDESVFVSVESLWFSTSHVTSTFAILSQNLVSMQ